VVDAWVSPSGFRAGWRQTEKPAKFAAGRSCPPSVWWLLKTAESHPTHDLDGVLTTTVLHSFASCPVMEPRSRGMHQARSQTREEVPTRTESSWPSRPQRKGAECSPDRRRRASRRGYRHGNPFASALARFHVSGMWPSPGRRIATVSDLRREVADRQSIAPPRRGGSNPPATRAAATSRLLVRVLRGSSRRGR
jgi:hypothetical protein